MRIIGGTHKGHRFTPPKNIPARPTTDIAKEGLFNIINNNFYFDNLKALDLFGGTGSISYELASRGCLDITTVELDRRSVVFIQKTIKQMNFPISIKRLDVFKFIKKSNDKFNFIFAGPPYPLPNLDTIPDLIFEKGLVAPNGWLVLEHNPHHNFENHPKFLRQRNYGTTIFAVFENTVEDAENESEV
ncbi:MAG: RsmD family RNA methyltransferase [Chitinophagales bacterium]